MPKKLIFVYNADSGLINAVEDYFHKIVKPSTYQCNLCALTYNNLGMKHEWKEFVEELKIPVEFLHKDEFDERFGMNDAEFPSAYKVEGSNLDLFITKDEMNRLRSLDELILFVNEKS